MTWPEYLRARFRAFGYAFSGLREAFRTQAHVRIQGVWAVLMVMWGLYERLSPVEWGLLASAVALVLVSELMNTALESAVDLATREHDPLAGRAKDVAAAAVLVAAGYAIVMTAVIFGPRIWTRIAQ